MCSELPKEFQKTTEVLPFTKYGISSLDEFKKTEKEIQHLEWLKKVGLTSEEIKLYQDNEAGLLDQKTKVESNALKEKLEVLYGKINDHQSKECMADSESAEDQVPSTSERDVVDKNSNPGDFYPDEHPINELKKLEEELFGHLKDKTISISKRRKIIRRLERKREMLLARQRNPDIEPIEGPSKTRPGSLWDVRKLCKKKLRQKKKMGPHNKSMYTIKDNKIVRLEPTENVEEYQAVDIVVPINAAEEQLLEGTQMRIDDIRKIERFKDYEPGIPSKVLYLKNIAPTLSREQLSLLFNQFQMENGGPVDLRLMSGRMHGQAFATFQKEYLAIQALAEINGTILGGQPIIAQFGRNSNRIQIEENR